MGLAKQSCLTSFVQNDHYVVRQFEDGLIDVLHPHACSTVKTIQLCCLEEYGMCTLQFCPYDVIMIFIQ